jgi:TP901 family phage tail tape measure protein
MADDIQSNIRIGIDTTDAMSSIKNLQRKISAFHTSMANGSAANAAAAANLQRNLLDSINATGKFSANITRIRSTAESFTDSLEKNKFSIGQYFKYAGGASKSFGRIFTNEFNTIEKVARERVKSLQTQYIKLNRDANGALQGIKIRPLVLDMDSLATKTAIAAQKQQILNQLLKQGSTNLLNFGKNTQWAGRQLMVGFTIPLSIFGSTAAKTFMQLEEQAIRFRRVYGEMFTTDAESDKMLKNIKQVASEFTKYGVAVEKTMGLAADAAAMGKQGNDLIAQVREANRLAVLGQVEQAKALETTISVTNSFGTAAEELAGKIDFLNAVENQTVTSIEDLTIAVPKAGPVVKQLGGDVEDLAFFLTAMKEGGINASEGANALKSGLASIINPTKKATEMLAGYGINVTKIVESNKGDVKGTVIDFATALDKLDPLKRARAIEQLFGKFQFSRLSTLFQNVIGEGTQAQRVLELASSTSSDLARLSAKELSRVSESPMFKFKKSIEDIKAALAPVGEIFLKLATPLIEFGTKVLNAFNSLDEKTKSFVTGLVAVVGGIGPILLMTFGLLANGVANLIKGFVFVKNVFNKASASSRGLAGQLDYMTDKQIEATAVAASLDQSHSKLAQTFSSEASAVNMLTAAYRKSIAAQTAFSSVPAISRTRPAKYASGVLSVPGPKGAGDVIPAMLSPGEAVIPADKAQKYSGFIRSMISGNIPGFVKGFLGMPSSGKAVSKNRDAAQQIYESFLKSGYANVPPTNYGHQIAKTAGHSFPIFGLGGVYQKGSKQVFVKPVLDQTAALAEMRSTQISRMAHGLEAPEQRIVVIRDPMDVSRKRRFLALESDLNPKFVNNSPMGVFNQDQYFKQLVASLLRADKDLSASNVFGNVVADAGPAGVFSRASGARNYDRNLPSMEEQAMVNLLGVKGGAKRAFAESTLGLMSGLTPQQYQARMIKEIQTVLPKLKQTIASFKLTDPTEVGMYDDMVRRLEAGLGVDWSKFHGIHSAVKIPKPKVAKQSANVLGLSNGIVSVPGPKGAGDVTPAMLSPGEAVIPTKMAKKYAPLIHGMISNNIPGYVLGKEKKYQKSHIQKPLDPNDPDDLAVILEEFPNYLQAPQSVRDRMQFSGSLTADLGTGLNQALRVKEKQAADGSMIKVGGVAPEKFIDAWDAIDDKLLSSAISGGLDPEDPAARKALKEIEDEVGREARRLAAAAGEKVTDPILANAADEIIKQSKAMGGKKEEVARQLESRKRVLGDSRSDYAAAELEFGMRPGGELEFKPGTKQIVEKNSQIVVGDQRAGKNGKPGAYKQKAQQIGGYSRQPVLGIVREGFEDVAMLGQSKAGQTEIAAAEKAAAELGTKTAKARIGAQDAELGKEEYDPYKLQSSDKRNSPHPQAGIDGADDAKARVAAQEKVYKRQQKRVTGIQNANGGMDIVQVPMGTQSQPKNTKKSTRIIVPGVMRPGTGDVMDADGNIREINRTVDAISSVEPKARNLSNVMRGLSFGLSSLTTAALFSGQLTGEFGNTVLGATYALTALTEIANVARASGAIGLTGKFQGPLLAGKSGVTGSKITDFFKRMVTVGGKAVMSVGKFAGILGIAITVISGFIMLNNWINDQREKERLKIEGLGDAASLTSKQLKTLGNFYGKESVQTAFEAGGANIGPASAEKRASIAKLSADENFQNEFKTTIATLKTSTTKQVKQAFESLSLTLFAQGYDTKTIQDIIDTLRVEAGKKDVVFEVASIDIKTKAGRANFNKSVDNLLKDYQDAFDKGSKKQIVVKTDTTMANMATGYGYEDTPELMAQTDAAATMLANNIDSVQTAFDNGQISLETYNELMDKAKTGMTSLNDEGMLAQRVFDIYKKSVEENNPALYSLISNVKGAGNQFIIMQAIMSGAIGTVEDMAKVIGALAVVTDYLNGNAGGYSPAQFLKAKELIDGVSSKIKAATIEQQKLNDEAANLNGGGGEESAFTKAKNDIVAQTKEIQNQLTAFRKLKAAGIETDEAFKMASNSMFAAAIAAETVGTAKWKELISLWKTLDAKQKAVDKAEAETLEGKVQAFEDGYTKITEAFSAYEEQATASFNVTNKKDLDLIDEMNSKIAALQYKLDGWQSQLDDIQIKEDAINESYDKKIEALDKVAAINETLIAQQKSQLTIADALTRGDISAAAVAIQDAQAQNAAASAQDQKDRLETARQAALNGVTVGGKTRLQIEKEIKDTTAEIKKLEDESLKPAEERVRLAEEKLQKDIKSQLVAGKTREEWDLIASNIRVAKTQTDEFVTALKAAEEAARNLNAALAARTTLSSGSSVVETNANGFAYSSNPMLGGTMESQFGSSTPWARAVSAFRASNGGMVPKYFAAGGFARGTDTVPAMLTPGEFVVKKHAVENFGTDRLKAINNGSYSGESVYNNYELNVNVRSDANPSEIARVVISQIKQIDSQRVRGIRL